MNQMDTKLIQEIVKIVSASSLTSLEVEEGDLKLKITNNPGKQVTAVIPEVNTEIKTYGHVITSPVVGVFHGLSKTGGNDLAVGDSVKVGDRLCVIEAMKIMNDLECDVDGVITEIFVSDGDMLEYGQRIFSIEEE